MPDDWSGVFRAALPKVLPTTLGNAARDEAVQPGPDVVARAERQADALGDSEGHGFVALLADPARHLRGETG